MVSLLRKKRQTTIIHDPLKPTSHAKVNGKLDLRHSLSLPDLTTPLLDPSSWEEIPEFPTPLSIPSIPNQRTSTPYSPFTGTNNKVSRNRSPSLIGSRSPDGTPGNGAVAFHKPFGSWQVLHHEQPIPVVPVNTVYRGDFRKSAWSSNYKETQDGSRTGAEAYHLHMGQSGGQGSYQARRRKKGRVVEEKLNVMVVGGKGVGKTR